MSEAVKMDKRELKNGRDNKGRFVKGSVHNPCGNTHTKDIDNLIIALDKRAKREGYEDFEGLVAERAIRYETVLVAVLKKIYPEKLEHSGQIKGNSLIIIERYLKPQEANADTNIRTPNILNR